MATVSELVVLVTANTKQFQSGMGQAESTASRFGNVAKIGFGIAAVAAVAFAASAVESYNDHQEALLKLQNTIDNSPKLIGASTKAFEEQATSLQNLTGFQDEEVLKADAVLGRFNLTAEQLQKVTPLVLDYARATGTDVTAAAGQMGKAMLGNARALKALGINFTATGKTGQDFNTIVADLQSKVGGLAEAYGKTLPGQLEIAAAKFDDVKETIGKALIPILTKLLDLVKPLIGVLQIAADHMDVLMAAGLGFAAWKFIPPLLDAVAAGLAKIGFTGAGVALLDFSAAAGSMTTAAVTAIPVIGMLGTQALASAAGTQTAAERTNELTKAFEEGSISAGQAAAQMRGVVPPAKAVADGMNDVATKTKDTAAEQADLAGKLEAVTTDMKAQKEAAHSLAGGLLGLTADAIDLADKQHIVNQMQEAGHDSGKKYNQAVLDLLDSQNTFKGDIVDFIGKLRESGLSLDEAKEKVLALGKGVGLTKHDILDALGPLDEYSNKLKAIPHDVTTNVTTVFRQQGDFPNIPHGAAGGIITHPTVLLAGEAGPEALIPLSKANQMAGINGDVTLLIDGQVLAKVMRDQLLKLGNRNAGTGL